MVIQMNFDNILTLQHGTNLIDSPLSTSCVPLTDFLKKPKQYDLIFDRLRERRKCDKNIFEFLTILGDLGRWSFLSSTYERKSTEGKKRNILKT